MIAELNMVAERESTEPGPKTLPIPFFEVLRDGSVRKGFDPPTDMSIMSIRPWRSDSLLVHSLRRPDSGPAASDILSIVDDSGEISTSKDISGRGWAHLLAATEREAIIQRHYKRREVPRESTYTLFAHDLTTGTEREIARLEHAADYGDASARSLAVASKIENAKQCEIAAIDVSTGMIKMRARLGTCGTVGGVNISPNGKSIAVLYEPHGARVPTLRLAIVDSATGRSSYNEAIGMHENCINCIRPANSGYIGMGWLDAQNLRVVFMKPLPADVKRSTSLPMIEDRLVLKQTTI